MSNVQDSDLRLMKLNQELTEENQRLSQEVEKLGAKNVELVFKADDLEEQLGEARTQLETIPGLQKELAEARQALEEARAQADGAAEKARAEAEEALQKARAEGEGAVERARAESREALEQAQQVHRAELERLATEQKQALEAAEQKLTQEHQERMERYSQQLSERTAEFEEKLKAAQAERDDLKNQLGEAATLTGRLEEVTSERDQLTSELEGLRGELEQAREHAAGSREELATAQAELATAQAELSARDARVLELETLVQELKTQYLERATSETTLSKRKTSGADIQGNPGEVLTELARDILGATGPILVTKVFKRCQVDAASATPDDLNRVVTMLEEFSRELTSADRHATLCESLARFREALANPEESVELIPEGAEVAPPVFEPPVPVEVAAPEEEPVAEESQPEPEPEVEAEPESEAETQGDSKAPAAEVVRIAAERETDELESAQSPELVARIEEGMKLLGLERYEESLDLFIELHTQAPDCLEVQTGLFYNYVGFSCWMEAYDAGKRVMPTLLRQDDSGRFARAMTRVLKERLEQTRDLAEKKAWLLELAELHLDKPQQALKYLRQAHRIPDEIDGEGRMNFYLTRLLEDTKEERLPYLHGYMGRVADSPEVFRHIEDVYASHKLRDKRPVANTVLALGRQGREAAEAAEKNAPSLQPQTMEPGLVEQSANSRETAVLDLFLDRLIPAAKLSLEFPSPAFAEIHQWSEEAAHDWRPATATREVNGAIFEFPSLEVRRYDGDTRFLVWATPEPHPCLIFHGEVEALGEEEQRFLALRQLYQIRRRHFHLYRAGEGLGDGGRRAMLEACHDVVVASGGAVTGALRAQMDRVSRQAGEVSLQEWQTLLERLYSHTRAEEFRLLSRFFCEKRPFQEWLETSADRFAARAVGLTTSSYAIAHEELAGDGLYQQSVDQGMLVYYQEGDLKAHRHLRQRLQRLWLGALE